MCFYRFILLLSIILSLPTSNLSSIAARAVSVQTLTQFIYHNQKIYVYSNKQNDESHDCKKWQFFYVPAVEPSYNSASDWIWTKKTEIRFQLILDNEAIRAAAQEAIAKKYTYDQVKQCGTFWDVSPLMIESLTTYVISGNHEILGGVLPYSRIQPNTMSIICRFYCDDPTIAENVKNKILDGSLDIEVFIHFDGFTTVTSNRFIINMNELNAIRSNTITDGGSSDAKYVHRNQANEFIRAYLQNVKRIIHLEDFKHSTSGLFHGLEDLLSYLFHQAFLETKTIYLNMSDCHMIWQNINFDPNQFSRDMNDAFKLNARASGTSYSGDQYFDINQATVGDLKTSSSSILRPFWRALESYLSTTKQEYTITESKIKSMLKEQLITITLQHDKFIPTSLDVLRIIDVTSRMQIALINQQFITEKSSGGIARTISALNLDKINHLPVHKHDWSSNIHSTMLPLIDSTSWICNCSSSLIVDKSLTNVEVTLGQNATFTIVIDADQKPKVKWFFAYHELTSTSKYQIKTTNNTHTLIIHHCNLTDAGTYRVSIENSFERLENFANLTVKIKPYIIERQLKKKVACIVGQDIELSWKFSGFETPRATWFFGDQALKTNDRFELETSDGESILIIETTQMVDSGVYTLLLSNSVGQTRVKTILTVVEVKPSIVTDLKEKLRLTKGENLTLELVVTGGPVPSVLWMKNKAPIIFNERIFQRRLIAGDDERWLLVIQNNQLDDTGEYWAKIENTVGSINSKKCQISIVGLLNILPDARWSTIGTVVVDGIAAWPRGLAINQQDGTVYIADSDNNRIVSWSPNERKLRELVKNLKYPTNVLIDNENNSMIIADHENKKVIRWSLQHGNTRGETIIDNIHCWGLTMDDEGALYVSDNKKHEVRRYAKGDSIGIPVAGGNGRGRNLDQLDAPEYIAVDSEGAVYVSDHDNHRVVKWNRGAKSGIIVAGFDGHGSKSTQLSYPQGVVIDANGNLYIADCGNYRIIRYRNDSTTMKTLADSSQLNCPKALAFDREFNLYVTDNTHRVLLFSFIK